MLSLTDLLRACRVPPHVSSGTWGVWTIARQILEPPIGKLTGFPEADGSGVLTVLGRVTMETLHTPYGEIVMEDSRRELERHLPILLTARGRVLISGLGLGCVVRGLLEKPEIEHIDVVELDPWILGVVGPEFMENPRVTLHQGDALTYPWFAGMRWDYAWHDVWCEEGSLDLLHAELLSRYRDLATWQGAWQFHRTAKRIWPDSLLNSRRRKRLLHRTRETSLVCTPANKLVNY